jgi:hypothetical protein
MFSNPSKIVPNVGMKLEEYENVAIHAQADGLKTVERGQFPEKTFYPLFEERKSGLHCKVCAYTDDDGNVYRANALDKSFDESTMPLPIQANEKGRYEIGGKVYKRDQLLMACRLGIPYSSLNQYVVVGNRFCKRFGTTKTPVWVTTTEGATRYETLEQASKATGVAPATISRLISSGRVCKRCKAIFSRSLDTHTMKWHQMIAPDGTPLENYFMSQNGHVKYPNNLIRKPGTRLCIKGTFYDVAQLFLHSIP